MKYYIMENGERKGPFELDRLPAEGVRPSTYVWCKGMADWEKAEDVAEVCRLFRNRIHDLMHPDSRSDSNAIIESDSRNKPVLPPPTPQDALTVKNPRAGNAQLTSVQDIAEHEENSASEPSNMVGLAWLVTFICFPPTGIAAIVYAYKSRNAWKNGNRRMAFDYNRTAKMLTGISFFLGMFVVAFVFRYF